jgi:hypothetical protein
VNAAPLAAATVASTVLLAVTPVAHGAAFSKEDVAGSLTTVRQQHSQSVAGSSSTSGFALIPWQCG